MKSTYVGRIAAATARLAATIRGLDDVALGAPSLLPGWDRAMVLTHLAANADGVRRTVEAATSGEVGEMYPGGSPARESEIEAGRGSTAAVAEERLTLACQLLAEALDRAPDSVWEAPATTPRGEVRVGSGLVVARLREVEVHHVDLDCGYQPGDWPFGWVLEEMDRAMLGLPARLPADIAVVITATDADQHWVAGNGDAMEVTGPLAQIFAWVTGRASSVSGRECPTLGPWH